MNKPSQIVIKSQSGSPNKDTSLADIIAIVLARKKLILSIVFSLTLLAGIILHFITPLYTAETLLMFDSQGVKLANVENVVSGLSMDAATIEGEIEVLRSRSLAQNVVEKLDLYTDPEFNNDKIHDDDKLSTAARSRVVDAFLKHLTVSQKGTSRVIDVAFTSKDAKKATTITNSIAQIYLVTQLDAKFEKTRRITEWLSNRVAELRQKVNDSESAADQLRQRTGLLHGDEVSNTDLIQKLRTQEAATQRKLAELSTEYGPRHPKMINLRAEAESIEQKIKTEIKHISSSSDKLIKIHALEREAEANRTLLTTYLSRMKEAGSQDNKNYQQPDARIVSPATIPNKPSFPKTIPILSLTVIGSTILALMLAFLFEHLDKGFRSGEEIEQLSGIPSLGFVPLLNDSYMSDTSLIEYILHRPRSAFGESINTLRWSITLPYQEQPPKIILFTSTQPKEGKTTIAMSFAITHSRAGKKVVLIDADCRIPRVNKALNLKSEPGLIEILTKKSPFETVIQSHNASKVDVIAAGNIFLNPSDVLASDDMSELLNNLSSIYDIVVIDSPPIMAASDAIILSRKADTSVFVVRWADTKRESVQMAIKQLQNNGGAIAGVLLSMVNTKKHSLYNYGDSGYYSGRLKNYYGE